mgnify:CR=1 FL=1
MNTEHGLVLEIQRMSTEDGPGIRTTVFFKGCTLKCRWCHNPESISAQAELVWHDHRCIACRSCVNECPSEARWLDDDGAKVALSAEAVGAMGSLVTITQDYLKTRKQFGVPIGSDAAAKSTPLARSCRGAPAHTGRSPPTRKL